MAVALSGGKDSAAAVLLLQKRGFQVLGVTMALGLHDDVMRIAKLKQLCEVLNIPLQVVEFSGAFERFVRLPFASAYLSDKTPNPCALCNREIKFGRFMDEALRVSGARYYATGHYAAAENRGGRRLLCEPKELRKSQVYFLALLEPERLERVVFPLAEVGLEEVRRLTLDLPLVAPRESQDACFLEGRRLVDYLQGELTSESSGPGDIVDLDGKVIGRHSGLLHYTVGQRRGVGFAGGRRLYVIAKDGRRNRLVLGEKEALLSRRVRVLLPVYWRPLARDEILEVKVRYQTPAIPAKVVAVDGEGFELELLRPVLSVTPGQIAVLYQERCVVAAGEIAD